MATRWRQRRFRRLLSGLCEPGEELALFERLGLGGWWVLSDRALYVIGRRTRPTLLPLSEIRSVRVTAGSRTVQVTVVSAVADAVIGDLPEASAVVARLRALPPATGPS